MATVISREGCVMSFRASRTDKQLSLELFKAECEVAVMRISPSKF